MAVKSFIAHAPGISVLLIFRCNMVNNLANNWNQLKYGSKLPGYWVLFYFGANVINNSIVIYSHSKAVSYQGIITS